ncbi:MAG: antirestriction protein ArdA [Oscillospiraceae bacterium]|nr:antirestriction protein ArdA [Oscillospiraceae bacterium]
MDKIFSAFVTNLGKYNEGSLVGEWVNFPTTTEKLQACFKRIELDGKRYEECFITDYDSNYSGLCNNLGEYESINELNYLAVQIDDMNGGDKEKFFAVTESGEHTSSVKDLINLIENIDCYDYFPNVNNEKDLGYYFADEMCEVEIPENIQPYFDYEAYGRDISINDNGIFTDNGFLVENGSKWVDRYDNRNDIPSEHKVFAYPPLDIPKRKALPKSTKKSNPTRGGAR